MNRRKHKFLHFLRNLLALGCLVFLIMALWQRYQQAKNLNSQDALRTLHIQQSRKETAQQPENNTEDNTLPRLLSMETSPLKELNADYRGWLTVYGTEVDLPVVQAKDNEYYLNHDFRGKSSAYGALFLDYAVDLEKGGNALIFGHNFRDDKTMFSSLLRYKNELFFHEHRLIRWEWGGDFDYYEIFAAMVIPGVKTDSPDFFDIQSYVNVLEPEQVKKLAEEIDTRAQFRRDVTLTPEDQFLFLCTCDRGVSNNRLLLCARKIRK